MKKTFFFLIILTITINSFSQTLFTYGKYSVDAKEFLRAFNKNNNPKPGEKAAAIREYLQLYINSRLRIREAYERGYDTLPAFKFEVENLRKQISENFMNDPEITPRLEKEAFQRSLKDIHIAHIFISFKKNEETDTSNARIKKDQLLQRLKKGEDFGKLAKELSDDTSARTNNGDLGYITVFTLPYEVENAIYSTPVGKYSEVVTSKAGYHIFKNLGERKALGKMKAKQILLVIPPGTDDNGKKKYASLADSLYRILKAGADFGEIAARYSNDYISAANGGTMPDISVGDFDPKFESMVWSLSKDGDISKPFQTSHGWHIVKRISVKPVVTDTGNKSNKQELLNRIMTDSRWKSSRDFIYRRVIQNPGIKKLSFDEQLFWASSDSVLITKRLKPGQQLMDRRASLYKIGDSVYTFQHFLNYAGTNRFTINGQVKTNPELMEDFLHSAAYSYYQDNLEKYNDEFRYQMAEFRDGNIFFEIMQQEIWNKAQNDSFALKRLYEENRSKYNWKKSAIAVIFYCSDESAARLVFNEVKKDPASWRKITEKYSEKVVADSSRFEWEQLPSNASIDPKPGSVTEPVVNTNDNSASFAYIISTSTESLPRSFEEAKGLVITDYQELLEKNWTEALRKKYPVKINEKVLQDISK